MLFIFHSLFPLCPSVGPDAQWFHPLPPVPEAGRDLQPTQSTPDWDLFSFYFVRRETKCLQEAPPKGHPDFHKFSCFTSARAVKNSAGYNDVLPPLRDNITRYSYSTFKAVQQKVHHKCLLDERLLNAALRQILMAINIL